MAANCFSASGNLKRSALQQIDHVFVVFGDIDRVFDIHRIFVFRLEQVQDRFHIIHQVMVDDQTFTCGIQNFPADSVFAEERLGFPVT